MTPSKILQAILGSIVALGFMAAVAGLYFFQIPAENKETLQMLIMQLSGAFITIVSFAFGSSVGSQRKDESVYVKKPAPAAPQP